MENENTKILKELEANSEMGLLQGQKMIEAVDGLEPVMEGILLKTDELVKETKNAKPSDVVININGDVESIKGEKGDTPEVDYDGINLKIAEMHKESMEVMQKELTDTVREDILTVAEAIKPELLHEVEEKIGEFGQVLLVDIKNVGDKVIQAESQIDVTDSNLKKLEERVDGIKIPTYDLSPFAKADDVTKEVNDVKKTIDDKVAETAKSIETLKGEVEKKVSDLEDEQMQRLQKVASKTVSLVELDDVNLDGLTVTNGKYDLGSGGGSSADKEVIFAYLSVTQSSNVASNDHVEFDTISFQKGTGITLSTGVGQANGIFTLPTEKYFKITCTEAVTFSGSGGQSLFSAYNDTDNVDIGMPGFALPYTNTSHATYPNMSVAYISTVGGAKDVYIKFISNANVTGIVGYGDSVSTYITIEEM